MKSTFFTLATIVACVLHLPNLVNADLSSATLVPPPKVTIGHTAILANNTVFIQGGSSSLNTASGASYAILLAQDGSINNATWIDNSGISNLNPRDFSVSAAAGGKIVNCATQDGARGNSMSCNILDTTWYNNTQLDVPSSVPNRGGMAYTLPNSHGDIYMLGGSTGADKLTTTSRVDVLNYSGSSSKWTNITDMNTRLRYHTATWVGEPVNGIVVLGGRNEGDVPQTTTTAMVYSNGNWTTRTILGVDPGLRFGHTVVYDNKGTLYLYGGLSNIGGIPANGLYYLNVTASNWMWTQIGVNPEPRAYHAATLLPDNTILYTFGQSGADISTATNMYALFDINTAKWINARSPNAIYNVTHSPNYTPPPPPVPSKNSSPSTSNNPNAPTNSGNSTGSSGTGSSATGLNIPMIAGICGGVVLLILLIILAIILIRRRNRRRPVQNYAPGPAKDMKIMYNKGDDEDEKAKQAKAFMIRRPPSVYAVNEDPESEIPHPHYKSQYYGRDDGRNSPSIAEYELREPGGRNTLSTVSSVAERRRYVEAQQRQFMDDYENTYNHPPPFEPNSKEEHHYDDDEEEAPLPSNRRANQAHSRGAGPRYPNARNNNQHASSNYDIDDYLE
ncbi:Serine/threonine-protein phosphatase bsl1 [Mortierella sp. AD094]|nr:Serine/threonine-protein phosphatase bsl1 [Mortierella sp. AD094]